MKVSPERATSANATAPIAEAFDEITRRLDCLHDEIARLEERLSPVLADMVPTDLKGVGDRAAHPGSSSLGRAAFELAARIEDVELRLGFIRRRVEL